MNFKLLSSFTIVLFSSASAFWLQASKKSYDFLDDSTSHPTPIIENKSSHLVQKKTVENLKNKIKTSTITDDDNSIEYQEANLIDNWDLEGTGLAPEDLAPFFTEHQPESIVIQSIDGTKIIYPKHQATGDAQSDKTLYISSKELIQKVAEERRQHSDSNTFTSNDENDSDILFHLPENAFGIESFSAGKRRDGSTLVPVAENLRSALKGPDYSFDNFPASDDVKMREHLSTVLPLGNGGTLILNINNFGKILANNGFDFSVYQTTFRIAGTDEFWQKLAYIGVSNTLDVETVRWFPCEPQKGLLTGCVGIVPTSEGGDHFNLAAVGVTQARYISIQDIGTNYDLKSKWPTEGCALDALRINHAYITK